MSVRKHGDRKKYAPGGMVFMMPCLIVMLILGLIPFAGSVLYSFSSGVSSFSFTGFDNYASVFGNYAFRVSVKNTLLFLLPVVPVLSVGTFLFSLVMEKSRSSHLLLFILALPAVLPVSSMMSAWSIIVGDGGVLDRIAVSLGAAPLKLLGDSNCRVTMIVIFIIKYFGYTCLLYKAAMAGTPRVYRDAFRMESDSFLIYAFKIMYPMNRPMVWFSVLLSVSNAFAISRETAFIWGNRPPVKMYMIQNYFSNTFSNYHYGTLCAASCIISFFCAAVMLIFPGKGAGENEPY